MATGMKSRAVAPMMPLKNQKYPAPWSLTCPPGKDGLGVGFGRALILGFALVERGFPAVEPGDFRSELVDPRGFRGGLGLGFFDENADIPLGVPLVVAAPAPDADAVGVLAANISTKPTPILRSGLNGQKRPTHG